MGRPLFLQGDFPMTPGDAVAAIIIDEEDRYVLQHRDAKLGIFFPDHWGCFGGGIEPGEDAGQALARELEEELALDCRAYVPTVFSTSDYDYGFAGGPSVKRFYYEVRIPSAAYSGLHLTEGQGLGRFAADEMFSTLDLTPYDAMVLWMHHCRRRFVW